MLVLTRKEQQRIVIDEQISLVLLGIHGNKVRIGIQAPNERLILRTQESLQTPCRRDDTTS